MRMKQSHFAHAGSGSQAVLCEPGFTEERKELSYPRIEQAQNSSRPESAHGERELKRAVESL